LVPEIDIREVSLDDTATLGAAYLAFRAGDLHGREGVPYWSEREFVSMFQTRFPDITRGLYAAYDGDEIVGGASTIYPVLDNLDKAYVHVVVDPDHRRLGIGTALEQRVSEAARGEGRPTVIGGTAVPIARREEHEYRRFAESRGYKLANVEIARCLELPIAGEQLDAWTAEAAANHAEYRIQTFDGEIPDELAESFCELLGLLAVEAPTGDLDFEPEVVPVESLRAREKLIAEQGRTVYTSLAIDRDGRAVADSVLAVPADDDENVMQWATLVHREHRGHRLGLAVKVANLRAMQAAHPERKRIWTQNSEVNDHMVSINEKLGFKPVELSLEFQRKDGQV
jgi:GNAT superfamily N-acetyltransferase